MWPAYQSTHTTTPALYYYSPARTHTRVSAAEGGGFSRLLTYGRGGRAPSRDPAFPKWPPGLCVPMASASAALWIPKWSPPVPGFYRRLLFGMRWGVGGWSQLPQRKLSTLLKLRSRSLFGGVWLLAIFGGLLCRWIDRFFFYLIFLWIQCMFESNININFNI